ncbi:putative cytochrome P450 E-class, group I [Chaetomidium leptoderma]|uniref:Cytochrome P450 E-class, group I n=1 Tax=Chaetomidium leptoderma TaxID=669021 RepID=A0AAN6VMY3_9PEZI|nr:putative cytochrome P450 E-class, group I [Chaetomidium leptoderma]
MYNLLLEVKASRSTFLLILAAVVPVIRQWYRLRHIPGPFLNSITPLVLAYHSWKEDYCTYVYRLCQEYGPLVRVTPNVMVFSDAQTFRHICSVKANYTKGLWFEFARWDLERYSCIAMRDNESRKERKIKLLPAWAGPGLSIMEGRVDSQVHEFLSLIERKYISTAGECKPMEFGHRAQFYTLDVVTSATFGKPFGFLKKDGDVNKYLEITESMMPMFGILGALPQLVYVMHTWPFNYLMPGEGDKFGFGRLMKFASDEVNGRREPGDTNSEYDLIGAYLRNGVEPEDVVQECITLVVAGSETTSVALRMALCALLTTPSAYRKVQDEVDAFYAEHTGDVISYADAKTLTYLQAVLRESMRLWPPSSGLFSKQVPNGGDTVHGYYLPPGTEIAQSMTGIGRTRELFGADSDIFRPERWLEASPQQFEEMASTVDLVFSTAKYICLGKHIALMELAKLLAEIFRRYDVAPINNVTPLKMKDPLTWLTYDFWIRFTRRT